MQSERYLFLIKGSLIMAQPLAAAETGELLTSLLSQGFVVAPLLVWASDTEQAMACYEARAQRQALASSLSGVDPMLAGAAT
ncbi:hypothetical protein ACW5XF_07620 [Aeromonas lusitana]|uniref:Uncharacterized protein n=1 Tax=Aeromonas lusitana TaxID=931529 RepID=A0A2M8H5J1_9GAMM|nr:hypothetical protein [Aeromonas lusitana]PJC91815.1 hypothetical protein CUC44_18160 [Aeromonas lusitana]